MIFKGLIELRAYIVANRAKRKLLSPGRLDLKLTDK